MSNECIFCKIVSGDQSSERVYSDEMVTAFRDINPVAPTHILIVPNRHVPSINEIADGDEKTVGHMFTAAKKIAQEEGIAEGGYRLIINCGDHGGQVVYHLHLHLIGGRKMRHPMG